MILGLIFGATFGVILGEWLVRRPYNRAKHEYDLVCKALEKLRRMQEDSDEGTKL